MIYDFDTTATSPVLPEVLTEYVRMLGEQGNNPSSTHAGGLRALHQVDEAKRIIARCLDCSAEEIIFTSGGTESINLALLGASRRNNRHPRRAVTTAGEHDAVIETFKVLRDDEGYEIDFVPLTPEQQPPDAFIQAQEGSCIISLIVASNETGAVNDCGLLLPLVRGRAKLSPPGYCQVCGKMPFSFRRSGFDFASLSGHKFGAQRHRCSPQTQGAFVIIRRRAAA